MKTVYTILAGVTLMFATGCENITDEQIQTAKWAGEMAHQAYHVLSGEECIFSQNAPESEVIVISGDEK